MDLLLTLFLFFVGFYVLIKGANLLIRGASSAAKLFGVSPWFIGVVIVGIGTSIPELSINIASAFEGSSVGLAAIIGSNTFNILFILGISALFSPLIFKREWIIRDLPINILAVLIAAAAILIPFFGEEPALGISRPEGAVLLGLLVVWLFFMIIRRGTSDDGAEVQALSWLTSGVMVVAGLIGVFIGGRWVVDGAGEFAILLGISPALVGFTLVAIGTSMPELVVSVTAAFKRQHTMAIGNVVGSNIFDFFGILGITALIRPLPVVERLQFDILAALGAAILLFFSALVIGKRFALSRKEGACFVFAYLAYFAFLFLRG